MKFKATIRKDGKIVTEVLDQGGLLGSSVYRVANSVRKQLSDAEIGPECDLVEDVVELTLALDSIKWPKGAKFTRLRKRVAAVVNDLEIRRRYLKDSLDAERVKFEEHAREQYNVHTKARETVEATLQGEREKNKRLEKTIADLERTVANLTQALVGEVVERWQRENPSAG
jgi:hypothetical protein